MAFHNYICYNLGTYQKSLYFCNVKYAVNGFASGEPFYYLTLISEELVGLFCCLKTAHTLYRDVHDTAYD